MPRNIYTDEDKARVIAELHVNEGNIKRTARNTGIPISTVRDWKTEMERGGVSPEVQAAVPAVVGDFVEDATRVRNKLLVRLEELVDEGKISERGIVPALGMLTDKIRAYKGLDTKKVEHTIALPSPEKARELFAGVFEEVANAAQSRSRAVDEIEGESTWEPALEALPRPSQEVTP